ncbi:choice-of-anchor G family protein [Microbacterium paludicola]|uniref:Choice-of-anchor G family protein n=1 Tax=Microbacterium paludicola TaxID=300019 RepID=A0A4Y9FV12_9MICO|nr:choice-of-anchor G family protein [Microbacterium paludicola]MBF0817192.1 choice-of-anchor G family protein [Microbacterium paludicola]TFU32058.1 choice-of-anchor G family protein [Microbacterium paludicola]
MSKSTSPKSTTQRTLRGAAAVSAAGAVIAGAAFGASAASATTGDERHHAEAAAQADGATTATQVDASTVKLDSPAVAETSTNLEEKLATVIAGLDERAEEALRAAVETGSLDLGPLQGLLNGGHTDIPELPIDPAQVIADVGAEPLVSEDGAVSIDLASGAVTVDLQTLIEVNGQPADATLADQAVVDLVKADVQEILSGVSDRIDEQLLAEVQGLAEGLPTELTSQLEGIQPVAVEELQSTVADAVGEVTAPAATELGTAASELGGIVEITVEEGGSATVNIDLPDGESVPLAG